MFGTVDVVVVVLPGLVVFTGVFVTLVVVTGVVEVPMVVLVVPGVVVIGPVVVVVLVTDVVRGVVVAVAGFTTSEFWTDAATIFTVTPSARTVPNPGLYLGVFALSTLTVEDAVDKDLNVITTTSVGVFADNIVPSVLCASIPRMFITSRVFTAVRLLLLPSSEYPGTAVPTLYWIFVTCNFV